MENPPPNNIKEKAVPNQVKLCLHCGTVHAHGKPHSCKNGTSKNTVNLVTSKSANTKGRVAAQLIREHFDKQGASYRGGTVVLHGSARNMQLIMGKEVTGHLMKPAFFTHEQMVTLSAKHNMSDNNTR